MNSMLPRDFHQQGEVNSRDYLRRTGSSVLIVTRQSWKDSHSQLLSTGATEIELMPVPETVRATKNP